jgi:hypothetical protein
MLLEVPAVIGATVVVAMVATLEPDYKPPHESQKSYAEADLRPVPMIEVHRSSKANCSYEQIEIGQTFVYRLGDPHYGRLRLPFCELSFAVDE